MRYVAGLLDEIGIGGERVRMLNLSSAMALQFAEAVETMTDVVREIGPNPLQDAEDLKRRS